VTEEKLTAREKLAKYCEVQKEQGRRGDVLIYGKHKYRMNRLVANLSDEECEKVVKIMELDAYIANCQEKKAARAPRQKKAVIKLEAKPCECGCGAMARAGSKFLPGHDARLKSALRKRAADGHGTDAKLAQKELEARGWAQTT
jgi:hypothetical protein